MRVVIDDKKNIIECWLLSMETESKADEIVKNICQKNGKNYFTVVYKSGKSDLVESTIPLLTRNQQIGVPT